MPHPMRLAALLLVGILLAGCQAAVPPVGALVGVELASVAVFGRGIGDIVYSGVTGRDCSIVRLEQGKTYCQPIEPPPARPAFCTRSLGGGVDCWASPEGLNDHPREVADGPRALTPEQERNRSGPWPHLFGP